MSRKIIRLVVLLNCLWILGTQSCKPEMFQEIVDDLIGTPAVQLIGKVIKVHYIGGWGIDTQVDTANRSFLLDGVFNVAQGAQLELRTTAHQSTVCEVGTERCAKWLGAW